MLRTQLKNGNNITSGIQPIMRRFDTRAIVLNYTFIFAILLLYGTSQVEAQASNKPANDLGFMRAYDGKYAGTAKLFDDIRFKTRLRKLLGSQYNYFIKSIWQVETPIKIENDFLYAWAMQTHSGGDPAATLLANFQTNTLYIEIIKDHKTTLYAEDGDTTIPKPLADWLKVQSSH